MNQVILLSMPFGSLERQALGLSLLKPQLDRLGISCDIQYLTFPFAEYIGYDDYQWISHTLPYTAFAGDWVFRQALYGRREPEEQAYVQDILRETWQLGEADIARLFRIRSLVAPFLDYCLHCLPWDTYRLAGFTSTFEQNVASLALAACLKARFPHLSIVFGGANWEGEMGHELLTRFPCVDYVCSGEADESFPALVETLMTPSTHPAPLNHIPGLAWREEGAVVHSGPARLIREMDALPLPDFTDYFDNLGESTVAASVGPVLLVETSRGCWWGEKAHCTFCGLNGGTMAYRSKGAARSLEELAILASRWQIDFVEVVDNIMDLRALKDLLPALARRGAPYTLFYEVKANLTKAQVQLLAAAGVSRIQPGIESMNDHILRLMKKGTTALRNIQLLKWCKTYGIGVDWNILYGFPGETAEDYQEMVQLLSAIRFLGAPGACAPIRLDRFSPYFNDPHRYGLTRVRPNGVYRHLYPFSQEALNRIAYFFEYDYQDGRPADLFAREVIRYCDEWRQAPEAGCLWWQEGDEAEVWLRDTRSCALQENFHFTGMEAEVYRYCDELRAEQSIVRRLKDRFPDEPFTHSDVGRFLQSLCDYGLMVTDGTHYLSLAVESAPAPWKPAGEDEHSDHHSWSEPVRPRAELPMVSG